MIYNMKQDNDKQVVFIQFEKPPLQSGEYTVTVEQKVSLQSQPFSVSRRFAVSGERFVFADEDINSVFPPNLANGEFSGSLPHVVFNRRTLPWERNSIAGQSDAPWLSVLLFNKDQQPPVQRLKAMDLVPVGTPIKVEGSQKTGTGTMPSGYQSYPGFETLNYGELPDDTCNVIDIPVALFNQIAPAKEDLPYLAHTRVTDTISKAGNGASTEDSYFAVVFANRLPVGQSDSYAYLISLENFSAYLPSSDGANHIPEGIQYVRLLCYRSWGFTTNTLDQNFKALLENLNKDADGKQELTTLQFPFAGKAPSKTEVEQALVSQTNGTLTDEQADTLVKNAFAMGYLPADHHLRHAGHTVSWFRGPLAGYQIRETVAFPFSCPDAANRYNPETGMFDVTYGAAWQLGQLLALQNKNYATALYNWKRGELQAQVIAEEEEIIADKYNGIKAFSSLFSARKNALTNDPGSSLLGAITAWMGRLSLLYGVPFNYLVPDERMLPPESMRFFTLDNNWIDSMLDGAFSIGRYTEKDAALDAQRAQLLFPRARAASCQIRQRKDHLLSAGNDAKVVTGFLLRSMLVSGWPGLEINAYSDVEGENEIPMLRMEHLSSEVTIALFDGMLQMVAVHEPPETLHEGIEGDAAKGFTTSLRVIKGEHPGKQIPGYTASIPVRADNQTIQVSAAATNILNTLNAPPLNEGITQFSSAEYALELIKGVVKVEFINTLPGNAGKSKKTKK
jgi:hypothetical protein